MGIGETPRIIMDGKMGFSEGTGDVGGYDEAALVDSDFSFFLVSEADGSRRAYLREYLGDAEVAVIPAEVDGMPVRDIGQEAFSCPNSKRLRKVFVPDSVTCIGRSAFAGCRALEQVRLPDVLDTLGAGCFKGCVSLETVNVPKSIRCVGVAPFEGCDRLPGSISCSPIFMPLDWTGYADEKPGADGPRKIESFLRSQAQNAKRYIDAFTNLKWSPATIEMYGFDEVHEYQRNSVDVYYIEFRERDLATDLESALLQGVAMSEFVDVDVCPAALDERQLDPTVYDDRGRKWADMPQDQRRRMAESFNEKKRMTSLELVDAEALAFNFYGMFYDDLTVEHLEALRRMISRLGKATLVEVEMEDAYGWLRYWIGTTNNKLLIVQAEWCSD